MNPDKYLSITEQEEAKDFPPIYFKLKEALGDE